MRESRRVARLTDKLFWTVGPAAFWGDALAVQGNQGSVQGARAENSNDFNAVQGVQGDQGTKIILARNARCGSLSLPVGRRVQQVTFPLSSHGSHLYPGHPGHPGQASNGAAFPVQGRQTRSWTPWTDTRLDLWREELRALMVGWRRAGRLWPAGR
jgi:hypothetical protein